MNEIPVVAIDEPYQWSEDQRELIARELEELARQVRAGVFGQIHAGSTRMRKLNQPMPGVDIMLEFTRPGPLP